MFLRKLGTAFSGLALMVSLVVATPAKSTKVHDKDKAETARVVAPVNLAILIQDDLISQVDNELNVTKDFIRNLPEGSRVMVGYITAGTLQVRQPFTTDLNKAASSLRILRSSSSAAPYNPYVEVVEALRKFDGVNGRKAVLLISDGLDTSRGFDTDSTLNSIDLRRAIDNANKRDVAIYTFYAPSVVHTSRSRFASSLGQSSLNRVANETGGKAFFQGSTGFVSFDSYFKGLSRVLNEQVARAY